MNFYNITANFHLNVVERNDKGTKTLLLAQNIKKKIEYNFNATFVNTNTKIVDF